MKKLSFIGKPLSKKEQLSINGGMQLRCRTPFFCQFTCEEGENCAVPGPLGEPVFGIIINGLCCV